MNKHYINLELNSYDWTEVEKNKILFKNKNKTPDGENIMVFTWVFSENYKKWQKSRNWYKYDQNWWELKNYARTPLILWQHQDNYWWIWKVIELYLDEQNNLWWKFYVDLDLLEDRNRKQVERWMVNMLSTWARTLDWAYEDNKTWKRYTEEEAIEKFWFDKVFDALFDRKDAELTYVVTKAELVENSLVTIGSNAWAIATSLNSINDEMKEHANKLKSLYFNNNNMNVKKDELETEVTEQEVETSAEDVETNNAVTEVEPKAEEPIEAPAEPVETPTEDNSIKELKDSLNAKDELINSLTERVTKLENQLNSYKEWERQKVLANAKVSTWITSMNDFSKKYF